MLQSSGLSPPGTSGSSGGKKATDWEPYGWKRGATLVRIELVLVPTVNAKGSIQHWNMSHPKKSDIIIDSQVMEVVGEEEEDFSPMPDTPFTGALIVVAEAACGEPANEITSQELEEFQWSVAKYMDIGSVLAVGYSYDGPYTSSTTSLTWVLLSRDAAKLDISQLARSTGLKKLDLGGSISSGDLGGLPIQETSRYSDPPAELAEHLGDAAAQLKEVNTTVSLESLDGITVLTGVERMFICGGHLTDTTMLANLENVTSLALDYCDDVADFSVLSVMPWLRELPIEPKGLWDIELVSKMPELTPLTLEDTSIPHMNGLEGNTTLTSLSTDRYGEIKDCGATSGLTRLRKLFLDTPYSCAEPDLNRLTGLTELAVSGFDDIGFLRDTSQPTMLTLDECQISDTGTFTGLTGLKGLDCSHVYEGLANWNFVGGILGLKVLDLSGVSAYEDVSSLFLTPTPQELYLNGMECELNLPRLAVNESLTTPETDGMEFHTNVKTSGGSGIHSIDYDKAPLDEHIDFLTNYPNSKNLSLAGNTLTNVDFASSLGALETLNISGNYATDLKPLETLKALEMVGSIGSPIENYRVLGDDVLILE